MSELYIHLFIFICLSIGLSVIIILLSWSLSKKNPMNEKLTPYECGFNASSNVSKPFSIRYFLVGILFLVFDLEVMYLFPWAAITRQLTIESQFMVFIFLAFLFLGLRYEWKNGGLQWQ